MRAKRIECRLISKVWLTPTTLGIRFEPLSSFRHEPGQFLSVVIPPGPQDSRPIKRAYSLASAPEGEIHELCVKFVPGGYGSEYLNYLTPGSKFMIYAPYGDFVYHPNSEKDLCMIATGSGIAPMRSIILSQAYRDHPPGQTTLLFGSKDETEILYPNEFESHGAKVVIALSRPSPQWKGFKGRVTDYLKTLPPHWKWFSTDFYICGNSSMVLEVESILRHGRGVPECNIFREVFQAKAPSHQAA